MRTGAAYKREILMEQTISQQWNLDSLYSEGSKSSRLRELITELMEVLDHLEQQLQTYRAHGENRTLQLFLDIINQFQYALSGWDEVDDFSVCTYAENVKDQTSIALMEESALIKSKLSSFQINFDQTLAEFSEEAWHDLLSQSQVQPFTFYLEERRRSVQDRLPAEQERLINALAVNGIVGWEQQHEMMLTKLRVPLEMEGEKTEVSIGQALNEAIYSPEHGDRQAAAAAIIETCKAEADAFAAVFNRVAGSRLAVYEQRGWTNKLKETVEQNRIQEASIRVMLASIDSNKELYKSYTKRKLAVDQLEKAAWCDLESPTFALAEQVTYDDAKRIIIKQFYQFSDKLGNFAEKAFEDDWIESENRPDKAEGGFCASLPLSKESRIFVTYRENYQDIITLAHELGHAYHNYILHEETAFAQQKGTSVAESASTFVENLVLDAVISQTASEQEKLAMLEIKIRDGLKYIVTVPNMFRFEQRFYEKRKQGPLTAEEIKTLITESENEFYGGLLDELAVYRWMYVSHFYDAEKPFYNIPYTIGYLFSNGIYALSKKEAIGFPQRYDALLRDSGRMTVEQLAERYLGVDLTQSDFWEGAQKSLKQAIEEYLLLTEKYVNKIK